MTFQFTKLFDDYCPIGHNQRSYQACVSVFTARLRKTKGRGRTDREMPAVSIKGCDGSFDARLEYKAEGKYQGGPGLPNL